MNSAIINTTEATSSITIRLLQEESTAGRNALTILYLVVLGLCFVVPLFYYICLQCDERQYRNMRAVELQNLRSAYVDSVTMGREEAQAAMRKYRDEKRARLLQLFGPVRMVLTREQFQQSRGQVDRTRNEEFNDSKGDDILGPPVDPIENSSNASILLDLERGETDMNDNSETQMVLLPMPGFHTTDASPGLRNVPGDCAICISAYRIGDDVVWSSNPLCEHCFHTVCMETWLLRQLGGPVCPCCRRDFVLDPLDDEGDEDDPRQDLQVRL